MAERIVVIVSGGMVQDVLGAPPGTVVEVHDYDTEGSDAPLEVDHARKAYALEVWGPDL